MSYSHETINEVFGEGAEAIDSLVKVLQLIKEGVSFYSEEEVLERMSLVMQVESQEGEDDG